MLKEFLFAFTLVGILLIMVVPSGIYLESRWRLRQFTRGEKDCKSGLPHKKGKSREYDDGYGFQYMKEQMESARDDR